MRGAKVIVTSFNTGREVRLHSAFPQHDQNVPIRGAILAMLGVLISKERTTDAGMEMDTIIINNDTGFIDGNEYLEHVNNTKTLDGIIRTFTRGNIGGALGGWDYAFKLLKAEYDYWIFTEDDISIGWPAYFAELALRFKVMEKAGYMALIGIKSDHPLGKHAHGAVGFTSTEVLNKVIDTYGSLPYPKGAWNKTAYILEGETKFVSYIEKIGLEVWEYPITSWNDKIHPYEA